jgi:hypothetical protein
MRERAPFAVPLQSWQDRHKIWNPAGKPLCRSQRHTPHVSASRPRCAEPPPRPPNRSRRTASRRGRSPAPLGQRAGGLRCSRLHSGACPHSPHLLPARSCSPHKSQFTRISYLASASPSPHICWAVRASRASREKLASDTGRRGFDRMRSAPAAAMIALASATGQARTLPASRTGAGEMMPCSMQFLMLSVLRGFAVRLRPRHAATSPGWEECPEQADLRVVALMAKTALSSAYSAGLPAHPMQSRSVISP